MTAALSVRDVRVSFGGVRALDGVTMEFRPGSTCGIIGPNGSGKTTLLGAMSRLTPLTAGSLEYEGKDYSRASAAGAARLGIARTFQTVRMLPSLDVTRNVMVGAAARASARHPVVAVLDLRRPWADNRKARIVAEAALDRVGMLEYGAVLPQQLPYGLQRRVEIARALATSPSVLLLDEPMAGMTKSEREDIADLLQDLRGDGLTQVLVEHDLAMIHRTCDTSYALDFGRVIASGPSREVAAQDVVREAYLGHQAVVGEAS